MTHVAQVSFFQDPLGREPGELLRDWPTLVDVAEAVASAGARVSVIQACARDQAITQGGVAYHFLAPEPSRRGMSENRSFRSLLRELQPDVVHLHGLAAPHQISTLSKIAPGTPILVQDHANRPPRLWRRRAWRKGLANAAAVSFCAREQAIPFQRARLFNDAVQIYAIPESSSRFSPGNQREARRLTGLWGDPCVLWVGHLDKNKDPLTVISGVNAAISRLPNLRLWCYFGSAPLLTPVQRAIAQSQALSTRVHLMGRVEHRLIEQAMRAADLFVLGSHREGSGYSLLEAMACGLPPVVSDIPSFRSLTGGGAVGRLWQCDDSQQLAAALIAISAMSKTSLRESVRAHFERELSSAALGRKLLAAYQQMLQPPRARI